MVIDPLAFTYARALLDLARAPDRVRPVLDELRVLGKLLADEREFRVFIESPAINIQAKKDLIERVLRGKLDDLVVDFLGLVIAKKRQSMLGGMLAAYEELYDREVGRVHVETITAVPLEPEVEAQLVEVLKGRMGTNVVLRKSVKPEIVGGIILRYADRAADGSVRTVLENLRVRLEHPDLGSELVHENQPR